MKLSLKFLLNKSCFIWLLLMVFYLGWTIPSLAQSQIVKYIVEMKTLPEDTSKVVLLLKISRLYQYKNPDSAIYYARLGIGLSKKLNYRLGEARHTSQIGTINEKHDNLDIARRFLLESLTIFKELNNTNGIASQYNGLGIIEGKKGNFTKATFI